MKITKEMYTETAHCLDGHPGRCRFIHGHSYKWAVTLEGEALVHGMLIDFSDLKKIMSTVIDPFDHALVLEYGGGFESDLYDLLKKHNLADRTMLVNYRPTAENMAKSVANELQTLLPNFKVTVQVWETTTSCATETADAVS